MAIDTSPDALANRIENLRTGYDGYAERLRTRNETYLRLFSPEYNAQLREHDQWADPIKASDLHKHRSSFNIVRAVVELWTALEAYPLPNIKWTEQYIPAPVPSNDLQEYQKRVEVARASRLVAQSRATMREQAIDRQHRLGRLERAYYQWVLRKNLFGHAWLCVMPDEKRRRFSYRATYDPSTVYPVWDAADQNDLAAILVVTRQRAQTMAEQYPDAVKMDRSSETAAAAQDGYYNPTNKDTDRTYRQYVWVEEYWTLDRDWETGSDIPTDGRAIYALRVNGTVVDMETYDGWTKLPYFYLANDNLRDHHGFSDAATVGPIQDSLNRFLSQQQDVIAGESRPKFKFRSEDNRSVQLSDEGVIWLNPDEDIEQLGVNVNVFPTQVHGQQLMEMLARSTGLNDAVFGRITASQNSGRALTTAWRSVAARMVPRLHADGEAIDRMVEFELDLMELYDWDSARDLFNGNRDYAPEFPNQEPRDFLEVTSDAIQRLNAGLTDARSAMEDTGEKSPDEMMERVRGDYVDSVLHPEKAQAYILLQREQQQMQIEAAQAQVQLQQQMSALQQAAAQPPGGAPGGSNGSLATQRGQAAQAQTQAAQQAAPQAVPGAPQPATQPGQAANATQPLKVSTLVQDGGAARNRVISQYG